MNTALITGGSGHVGANLVRELTKKNFKIKCIDFDRDHRAFEGYDVELIKGNIANIESINAAFKDVDVVFHTAALISLVRKDKDIIRSVNVVGTKNVCELSLKHNVKKLIHFSSVDAFVREPLDKALLEDRPLVTDPNAVPYDLSKADAQRIVYDYCEKGLDASIIHPSGIFGPNDFKPSLFGQEFINIANGKRSYTVNVGYDYVDVRDLCTTAINCVEKGESKQNYIVGGNYIDFVGIGEMMSKKLNKQLIKGTLPFFFAYLSLPSSYLKALFFNKPRSATIDSIHTVKVQNKLIPSKLAKEILSHRPRPVDETINDTVEFFQKRGLIK